MAKRGRPSRKEKYVPTFTVLKEDVHKRLVGFADKSGRSQQHIIQTALEEYFAKKNSNKTIDF